MTRYAYAELDRERPEARLEDGRRAPVLARRNLAHGELYSPCPGCGRLTRCDHISRTFWCCFTVFECACGSSWAGDK